MQTLALTIRTDEGGRAPKLGAEARGVRLTLRTPAAVPLRGGSGVSSFQGNGTGQGRAALDGSHCVVATAGGDGVGVGLGHCHERLVPRGNSSSSVSRAPASMRAEGAILVGFLNPSRVNSGGGPLGQAPRNCFVAQRSGSAVVSVAERPGQWGHNQ